MPDTQSAMQPPSKPPVIATGLEDSDIEKIGDQIASLTATEARKLNMYLEYFYDIKLEVGNYNV